MKNTVNPCAPIVDESRNFYASPNISGQQGQNQEFINYPDAIPEEVFVYFGNQVGLEDLKKITHHEMFLNLHFMRHFHQVLE